MEAKFTISPRGTLASKGIALARFFDNPLTKVFQFLLYLSALASLLVVASNFVKNDYTEILLSYYGFAFILIALALAWLAVGSFVAKKIAKTPALAPADANELIVQGQSANLFNCLSLDLATAFSPLLNKKKHNRGRIKRSSFCTSCFKRHKFYPAASGIK